MLLEIPHIDFGETVLETLRRCGGYYECPEDDGQIMGPLVGYAGKYDGEHHFVGKVYANFARLERFPHLMESWAIRLLNNQTSPALLSADAFCAAPFGGLSFADKLAKLRLCEYIYAEKVDVEDETNKERKATRLIFNRHEIRKGARVAIVEDVTNNFSTTDQMIQLITENGGAVTCIVSMLNRSTDHDTSYPSDFLNQQIPIISLVRKVIPQYRQDDPEVAQIVKDGRVIWKPKDNWDELEAAMLSA